MSASESLSVPKPTARRTTSRSNSASSTQRSVERVDVTKDLQSNGDGGVKDVVEEGRAMKIALPTLKAKSASDLRSGMASPMMPSGAVQ